MGLFCDPPPPTPRFVTWGPYFYFRSHFCQQGFNSIFPLFQHCMTQPETHTPPSPSPPLTPSRPLSDGTDIKIKMFVIPSSIKIRGEKVWKYGVKRGCWDMSVGRHLYSLDGLYTTHQSGRKWCRLYAYIKQLKEFFFTSRRIYSKYCTARVAVNK